MQLDRTLLYIDQSQITLDMTQDKTGLRTGLQTSLYKMFLLTPPPPSTKGISALKRIKCKDESGEKLLDWFPRNGFLNHKEKVPDLPIKKIISLSQGIINFGRRFLIYLRY
jgi:hypothetical protein